MRSTVGFLLIVLFSGLATAQINEDDPALEAGDVHGPLEIIARYYTREVKSIWRDWATV